MEDERVTVTVTDHKTGETETSEVPRDSYILVCGQDCYVSYCNYFPTSGTVQLTLKKGRQEQAA